MEGLFNERLQVRTRHLEERVSALTKQLAALKEDNARLLKSYSDGTHKVQLLEGDLKSERERCHKLSATLSSCRRNVKKKILRLEEGEYDYYDGYPASSRLPGSGIIYYQCAQCGGAAQVHQETLKHDRNYQLLPNYMGIMPARLNHKLMKSKKLSKSNLNHHKIAYHDGQVDLRRPGLLNDMGDHYQYCSCDLTSECEIIRCADCCRNVEIFLARRLHLNDNVQQQYSTGSGLASQSLTSKRQNQNRHVSSSPITQFCQPDCRLLHNIACKYNYSPSAPKEPVDQNGIINTSTTLKNPINAKNVEQDFHSLTAGGFYVRMETAKADHHQQNERPATSCGFDSSMEHHETYGVGSDYHDLLSLQTLKAENEALRGLLLSNKKVEIQELESELRDIKQCASSGATIAADKQVNLSSHKSNEQCQLDPIKFLDSLHNVEDKILQKKIAILGLECGDAHMGDVTKANCADHPLNSNGVHMKAHLNEDPPRHVLKALARDVVHLRQENQRLKQKCRDETHFG